MLENGRSYGNSIWFWNDALLVASHWTSRVVNRALIQRQQFSSVQSTSRRTCPNTKRVTPSAGGIGGGIKRNEKSAV